MHRRGESSPSLIQDRKYGRHVYEKILSDMMVALELQRDPGFNFVDDQHDKAIRRMNSNQDWPKEVKKIVERGQLMIAGVRWIQTSGSLSLGVQVNEFDPSRVDAIVFKHRATEDVWMFHLADYEVCTVTTSLIYYESAYVCFDGSKHYMFTMTKTDRIAEMHPSCLVIEFQGNWACCTDGHSVYISPDNGRSDEVFKLDFRNSTIEKFQLPFIVHRLACDEQTLLASTYEGEIFDITENTWYCGNQECSFHCIRDSAVRKISLPEPKQPLLDLKVQGSYIVASTRYYRFVIDKKTAQARVKRGMADHICLYGRVMSALARNSKLETCVQVEEINSTLPPRRYFMNQARSSALMASLPPEILPSDEEIELRASGQFPGFSLTEEITSREIYTRTKVPLAGHFFDELHVVTPDNSVQYREF